MDVTKMREDFSSHLLKLDELNKKLIDQIADLQNQLNEQQNHNLTTKALLLKTQNKLQKTNEENREHVKKVAHYKSKLRQTHEKTQEAERGWIKLTQYLKKFHNTCTCQPKDNALTQPSPVQLDISSPTVPPNSTEGNVSSTSNTSSKSSYKPKSVNPKLFFSSPKSHKLSRKRSSTNSKASRTAVGPILQTGPKQRVSKLKRTKPTSPKSVKKLCLSQSPCAQGEQDDSLVLYAADTQAPDDANECSVNSDISLVLARSPVKNNNEPAVCPDSPVSPILDLSGISPSDCKGIPTAPSITAELGSNVTETPSTSLKREAKQFGLLTECKNNISISEEKLGFSLPENMANIQQDPCSRSDAKAAVDDLNGDEDDDFKIRPTSKPSNHAETPTKNVKTDYKYTKVVRKKEERAKLAASSCPSCYRYYKACGLDEEEIAKLIGDVSRHRHQHGKQNDTPPSFWDLTIGDKTMPTEPATQRKPRKNRYITRRDS